MIFVTILLIIYNIIDSNNIITNINNNNNLTKITVVHLFKHSINYIFSSSNHYVINNIYNKLNQYMA